MWAEVRIPLVSAEERVQMFLDRQREAATNCCPPSSRGTDVVPGMSLSNCTLNGENAATSPSLSMMSLVLSERPCYFSQICGPGCNGGEAAQRCTFPSLETFYKGFARELLDGSTCRSGSVVWGSGWGWLEKVCTLSKKFPALLKLVCPCKFLQGQ